MSRNSISFHRLKHLLGYEWAIDKRFYLLGTAGILLMSFGVFLTIWFSNISGFVWTSTDYNSIFFGGFVFLSVFGISQGFIDLREKNTSIRYLTLPSSAMEKFIAQVCFRLIVPIIVYLFAFWLGANISIDVYYFFQETILRQTALPEIHKAELLYLYWTPDTNTSLDIGYWLLFGTIVSIPLLMFMGGIVFGKWGFITMPITIGLFIALLFGSYYSLSWLIYPVISSSSRDFGIPIGKPEVFEGVPLFVLVCLILIWFAVFLSFYVTYLKLKEREI